MIKQAKSVIISLIIFIFSGCSPQGRAEVTIPPAEVEVVNGTGIHRLARAVAWELLSRGFNVYSTSDAEAHYQRTVVRDLRNADGKMALAVARALAKRKRVLFLNWGEPIIPPVEVKIDSGRFVDVEIILGDDYQQYFPEVVRLY